jgi:tetratricopeptide (TPR) repeat protein
MRKLRAELLAVWFCLAGLAWSQSTATYAQADALVRQGRSAEAVPLLENMLEAAPGDLRARNLLGIALMNSGRGEEASAAFRGAIEIDPAFHPALRNLAVNETTLGHRDAAKGHFERLLKLQPQDPVAHFYLGEMDFDAKRYAQALAHYEQSGELSSKDPRVALRHATSAVESQNRAAAARALARISAAAEAGIQFEAGLLFARLEQYAEAAECFERAQKGLPDPYQAGFNLTLVRIKGKNYAAAIEAGEQLLAQGYRKAELYNLLARAYEPSGRLQDAYDALRAATEIDPQDETNYVDLMLLCFKHEDWDLSLEISEVALGRIPRSYRVRLQRGAVLALKGLWDAAESEFVAAAKEKPEASLPHVMLAQLQISAGRREEGIALLRAQRSLKPDDYLANWLLAEALSQEGALPNSETEQEAVAALQKAVEVKPDAAPPRVLLGKMLAKRGDLQAAARQFEQALKLDPNEISAVYQLALIDQKTGNTKRAEELLEKVSKARAEDPSRATQRQLVRFIQEEAR